jgi:hypothetical protein
VIVGLAPTRDGLPVRSWVFPGNTMDATRVAYVKGELRGWNLGRAIFVGDAGIDSAANRRELVQGPSALAATCYRNMRRGASWSRVLPVGYGVSLSGALMFLVAGVADMLWHVMFGIEDGVEGLISPTHLGLALGGGLIVTGPLRAGLHGGVSARQRWIAQMPMVLSLTLFLSLITFFTEYASPYGATWVALAPGSGVLGAAYLHQSVGLAGFLVQPAVLTALVLFVLRSRLLPLGSLTFLLSVNVALMATIHDKYLDTGPYPLIGAAVVAGLTGDGLLWWLRPSPDRIPAFRMVAVAIPAVQYLLYFVAIMVWARVTWSVHLWTGAIVIAGGVGWLLSYLVVPPGRSATPLPTRSDSTM